MHNLVKEILEVSCHRNGICGAPFHAIRFIASDEAESSSGHQFLATVFHENGHCAVIDLDLIAEHGVSFGYNSWRGDHFEPELRKAIKEYQTKKDEEWKRLYG